MLNDYHGPSNVVKRSTIPGRLGSMSTSSTAEGTEPRWLSDEEQCTWRNFLTAWQWLFASVDGQLQRDAGILLAYYEILVRLSEAPDRALRMTQPAGASASSKSRVSHAV